MNDFDFLAAAIAAAFPIAGIGAGLGWWRWQIRRARPVVRRHVEQLGCHVVTMRSVLWRPWRAKDGPFPRTGSPLTRAVFRLLVRRGGHEQEVWARWGGTAMRLDPEMVDIEDRNGHLWSPANLPAQYSTGETQPTESGFNRR